MQYSQLYVNHMIPTYQSSNIDTPSISPDIPEQWEEFSFAEF